MATLIDIRLVLPSHCCILLSLNNFLSSCTSPFAYIAFSQRSFPSTSISNQVKEGAPPTFTSLPSSNVFAPLWPRQDDPVDRLNQIDFGASIPISSDNNVSRLASLLDAGPPENLV